MPGMQDLRNAFPIVEVLYGSEKVGKDDNVVEGNRHATYDDHFSRIC